MEHEATVWFAKSFGLFYLIAMSIGVVVYALLAEEQKVVRLCGAVDPRSFR